MTKDKIADTRTRLAPPKFRCEKCGRLFITAPKDGVDHYYPPYQREGYPCMGSVTPAEGTKS